MEHGFQRQQPPHHLERPHTTSSRTKQAYTSRGQTASGHMTFFVPFEKMLPESAANYQRMLDEDPVIESDDEDASALETMLMNARLENIKARTKTLEEKLAVNREMLWR